MAHLYHFCALLPRLPYVDLRPAFTFTEHPTDLVTATVTLPSCVSSLVRTAMGKGAWHSERTAMKDAAFQAYHALFQAGLLNQNLLPLTTHDREMLGVRLEELPALVEVRARFDPWSEFADAWPCPAVYETTIALREHHGNEEGHERTFILATPLPVPAVRPFRLYWNETTTFTVHLRRHHESRPVGPEILQSWREATRLIHRAVRSDRTSDQRLDFVVLISPDIPKDCLPTWSAANQGRHPAAAEVEDHGALCRGFVRTRSRDGVPYIFQRWDRTSDDQEVRIKCTPLPRRRNFLQCGTRREESTPFASDKTLSRATRVETFLARDSTIDLLPTEVAQWGLFIPAILQHIELELVCGKLCATILRAVRFHDKRHVATAIMCPSAQWLTNYQRYEFIGDAVLKFTMSCLLFTDHPHWHEGYLSEARSQLVSNNSLAHAAIRVGLDAYIITEPLRARRQSPLHLSDIQPSRGQKREVPVKVLADVTEALIGAAFVDGGLQAARSCMHAVLPDFPLEDPSFDASYPDSVSIGSIDTAESLIGRRFDRKALLLEALTHPACERDVQTESYQRLEFLGDAVLDMLVTSFLVGQNLSQGVMTQIKAALVNANLLGFFCMDFSIDRNVPYIREGPTGVFEEKCRVEPLQLWKFMRHHHREVSSAQERCQARYQRLQHDIRRSMEHGMSYPWVELARLSPDKFYSDLIESTLGALFVDSKGDLAVCQAFVERIGVAPYLRRMAAGGMDIVHPRNALARAAGSNKVEYSIDHDENVPHTYRCTVSINGLNVVEIGSTKDESMIAAADAATRLLGARGSKHGEENDGTSTLSAAGFDL